MTAKEKFLQDLEQVDGLVYTLEKEAPHVLPWAYALVGMMEATYKTLFEEEPPRPRTPRFNQPPRVAMLII